MGSLLMIGSVLKSPPQMAFDVEGAVVECRENETKTGKKNHLVKIKDDTGEMVLAFWRDEKNPPPPVGAIVKLVDCTASYFDKNKTWYYGGKVWLAKSLDTAPKKEGYTFEDLSKLMTLCLKRFPPAMYAPSNPATTLFIACKDLRLKVEEDIGF